MIAKFFGILTLLLELLPDDPILDKMEDFLKEIVDYMGYVNYFIPFRSINVTIGLWASCIVAYFSWAVGRKVVIKYSDKLMGAVNGLKGILGIGGG